MTCPRTGTPSRAPAATIAAAFSSCLPVRVPVVEALPPGGAQATPARPGPCPTLPTTATSTPNTHSHTPIMAPATTIQADRIHSTVPIDDTYMDTIDDGGFEIVEYGRIRGARLGSVLRI